MKIKSFFSFLIVSYAFLLLMPFLAVMLLLNYWDNSSTDYYRETVENDVTEGRILFEQRVEALKSGAYSVSLSDEVRWVVTCANVRDNNSEDNYITNLITCGNRLNEAFADGELFSDYSVVTQNDYAFRRQSMSIGKEFFFSNYRNYKTMTYKEWYDRSFKSKSWSLLPIGKVTINGIDETAITFNYPVRYSFGSKADAGAVIQFFIKENDLIGMFSPILEMYGDVYIFDDKKDLLAIISNKDTKPDWNLEEILSKEISGFYKIGEDKRLVVNQKSEGSNFTVIALLPPEIVLMHPQRMRRLAILLLGIIFLFEILLGYIFAKQFTMPLKKTLISMQSIYDDIINIKRKNNKKRIAESEMLEEGVNSLLDKNNQMKDQLKNKDEKYKAIFFSLLYSGNFKSDKQVSDEAKAADVELYEGMHYVMTIYSEYEDKIKEALEKESTNNQAIKSIFKTEDKVLAILLSCEEDVYETGQIIKNKCEELNKSVGKVFIGQGRMYVDKSSLCNSYRQAYYSMEHALKNDSPGCVIHYDDVSEFSNLYHFSSQMRMQLVGAAKSGDKEQVEKLFSYIYEQNFTKAHLRKIIKKCLISEILSAYLDTVKDIISTNDVMPLVEKINDETDARKAMKILEEGFGKICDDVAKRNNEKEAEYHNKLKIFIEENYTNSQFDLISCAETFGLSESYFSTFFKDIFGTTFSSYLEKTRLEKAKVLIIENKMDLEKIAASVGYSSSATFRRAFKRVFGVSPSTWKQLAQQI